MTTTATRKPKQLDPLDALAQGDPLKVIALMLWKARRRQPDLYVQIDEQDIQGFEDCVAYLKVKWKVNIERPAGLPAQPALAGGPGRRPVPARAASGPKPFVIVTLVDARTGDAIRPVENNQDDFDVSQQASRVRKAQDQARQLAQRLLEQGRTGEFSLSDLQDAADALLILAEAV